MSATEDLNLNEAFRRHQNALILGADFNGTRRTLNEAMQKNSAIKAAERELLRSSVNVADYIRGVPGIFGLGT